MVDDNTIIDFSFANANLIRYPRLNYLHKQIQCCMELSKRTAEPQCMSIEGPTGAGKSTLARDYVKKFPRRKTPSGIEVPVFYAEIPAPATVKYVASELLRTLGDPGHARGTLWSMNSRLIGLIQAAKVELVILDEFSNLVNTETNRILNNVSEWLKMLIKQTGVPFVVLGIEGRVENVLNANEQLSRLFAYRETLTPFSWSSKHDIEEFSRFLQYAEKAIGMPLTDNVSRIELYFRIFYATKGVVANIMNLIRNAAIIAQENNRCKIELEDLALSFDQRIAKHLRDRVNPFTIPAEETFTVPKAVFSPKGEKNRKKHNESIIHVLSAS